MTTVNFYTRIMDCLVLVLVSWSDLYWDCATTMLFLLFLLDLFLVMW